MAISALNLQPAYSVIFLWTKSTLYWLSLSGLPLCSVTLVISRSLDPGSVSFISSRLSGVLAFLSFSEVPVWVQADVLTGLP